MKSLRNPLLILVSIAAMPANGIEPPAGTPTEAHDWECAYAYSDTTCEAMMAAWSEDVDLEGDIVDYKPCGDCTAKFENGYEGTKYLVGYLCEKRVGHAVKADDVNALVKVYRNGVGNQGWRVTDWKFESCLFVFECSVECGDTLSGFQCFATSGYSIGRWTPLLAESCRTTETGEPDGSEEQSDDSSNSEDQGGYTDGYEYP